MPQAASSFDWTVLLYALLLPALALIAAGLSWSGAGEACSTSKSDTAKT